jgi:hypothetical protein
VSILRSSGLEKVRSMSSDGVLSTVLRTVTGHEQTRSLYQRQNVRLVGCFIAISLYRSAVLIRACLPHFRSTAGIIKIAKMTQAVVI